MLCLLYCLLCFILLPILIILNVISGSILIELYIDSGLIISSNDKIKSFKKNKKDDNPFSVLTNLNYN